MQDILPLLGGGLVLFLYSLTRLSIVSKNTFREKTKGILHKFTSNLFLSIITGTVITVILGSSSVAIILTIVMVNAHTLDFRKAMGIVMGANIGTTMSSEIIAMDVGRYAVIPLAVGMVMQMAFKKKRIQDSGRVIFYFGALFFGLFLMETSVEPLQESNMFEQWMANLENHWMGAAIGGLVTLIIQSSSATVGLAITLGRQNLISVSAGIAVMLGAELGTCSDTLLATINGTRQAVKTGLFHLLFNLTAILLGLAFFPYFLNFVTWMTGSASIDNQIAHAHVSFNVMSVLFFLPFVGFAEKGLNRLVPEKLQPAYT